MAEEDPSVEVNGLGLALVIYQSWLPVFQSFFCDDKENGLMASSLRLNVISLPSACTRHAFLLLALDLRRSLHRSIIS
jgi:hypothetical protein